MPSQSTTLTARAVLAHNLRQLRLAKGLSQEGLADLAGLHRTYVGCLERSEKSASLDSIERLSLALGVDVTDLLQRQK